MNQREGYIGKAKTHVPSIGTVREYWDRQPCNIRHSQAEIGSQEYFDEVESRKYFVEPHIPAFAEFDRWDGKKVLEVGCGIGTDATNFMRSGAVYTGVDVSAESIRVAKQRVEVFSLSGTLIQADAEELDSAVLGSETFDLIYSFGVLHHTPDPLKALKCLRNLSHDQSEIRLMLYARDSWKASLIAAGLEQPEAQSGCPIAYTYSESEVRELLADAGFRVTRIEQDHIFPYRVNEYREFRYVREAWFEAMPENLFRALETQLGWHMLIWAVPTKMNDWRE